MKSIKNQKQVQLRPVEMAAIVGGASQSKGIAKGNGQTVDLV